MSVYCHSVSFGRSLTLLLVAVATSLVSGQDRCAQYGKCDNKMCTHHAMLVVLLQLTF